MLAVFSLRLAAGTIGCLLLLPARRHQSALLPHPLSDRPGFGRRLLCYACATTRPGRC